MMPVPAITLVAPSIEPVTGPASEIISQIDTPNADGTITVKTTYADGTTDTTTEPAPASSRVTKEVTVTHPDGTVSVTVTYLDGTTKTTTEASHNPTATDVLDPHNTGQLKVLLSDQEKTKPV
jgi:hypothetical protein